MTGTGELWQLPATTLSTLLHRRELSPVELLEAVLGRLERVDGRIYAFMTVDAERARDSARAAESALGRGEDRGPLHGLPVSIKDLEQVAGVRTTYGSRFFEDFVPSFDSIVPERVKRAGGVIFGKTNTSHFGHKDMCDNLLMPATRNPWKLDRTSGASSGGAGAAVAAGVGPLAQGSDGAGSIRIPASLCGIFGFKPSFGRVPYWPNPDVWAARSHNGPMARTVRDAALLLNAIAGPDPRDPVTIDAPPSDYVAACDGDVRGLKVAWSVDFGYAPVDPEVRRITEQAASHFAELGCEVESVTPGWDDPAPAARTLWNHSFASRHGHRYRANPDWCEPSFAEMIEDGLALTGEEVGAAQLARTTFFEQARRFMDRYDLLLTPQMPCTAWAWDGAPTIDGRPARSIFDRVPFTFPFNLTGWPAASVPCGFDEQGLPVGLQIVAPWHADALCLRAAAAFEASQPWAGRWPALD